jgi:hypothetical protein
MNVLDPHSEQFMKLKPPILFNKHYITNIFICFFFNYYMFVP